MNALPDASIQELCLVAFETGCRPQEILRVEARHFDSKNARWVFPVTQSKGKRAPRVVYLSNEPLRISTDLAAKYPSGPLFRNSVGSPWTVTGVNSAFRRARQRMARDILAKQGLKINDLLEKELLEDAQFKGRKLKTLKLTERRRLTYRIHSRLVPKYSLYTLRHSWATNALQSGVDVLTVANLMGHKDTSMVSSVYSHVSQNSKFMLKQARRAVGE